MQPFKILVDTRDPTTQSGISLLGEIAAASNLYDQFLGPKQLPVGHRPRPTKDQWIDGFAKALSKPHVREFITQLVVLGHQALVSQDGDSVASGFVQNPDFDTARSTLLNRADPSQWIAVAGFCLIRMAQVNASKAFAEDEWSDYSFAVMHLEEALRMGDGQAVASDIKLVSKNMTRPLHALIADRLPHGLSELLLNAPQSRLVRDLLATTH
jgi:hypothetical protein